MIPENELRYHHWANVRLLKHISHLDSEVFIKNVKSVFPSLSAVFEHIYNVDQLWIQRMLGTNDISQGIKFETPLIAVQCFERNFQQLIEIRTKGGMVYYQNSKGEPFQNKIEEILRHLINHGTYHRGNVSAILHQLGEKSISTDYIFFLRETE